MNRRWVLYVAVVLFAVMCVMIGFSEWWAYNKNVPYYQHRIGKPR